ncbi:gamma-mobile-trio integrase GmtZ [Pseudomonas koreensis]|uniref:gamma-mobile-trio integrase GmtZ n=1 Tax=Pseudomonas koreensis TaxID=198620 RepID=UPI001FF0C425|nr:integrase family protein [Pseudomonas koreensis]
MAEHKRVTRKTDMTLGWVERTYPQLAPWRVLAIEWIQGEARGIDDKLKALTVFFERYLIQQGLPLAPATLLARDTLLPDFFQTACPDSVKGIKYNNHVCTFIDFVLRHTCSQTAASGQVTVRPEFRNPVQRRSRRSLPACDESVYSPLPYGYLQELRKLLVAGPHFRDWHWAAHALGAEIGSRGFSAPDWFEVSEEQIDKNDPDCMWRERPMSNRTRLEMWSPVRWVALAVKLILPLRTYQVRMLDSGEADTWRYEGGAWILNPHRLAQGNLRRPLQLGVFRRCDPLHHGENTGAVLYINTNKTADIARTTSENGYVLPWPAGGAIEQDVFYWLEKLRNWQQKYNPVSRRTPWSQLDGRHITAKSSLQLAGYPDTCFLFRMPEAPAPERHLPLKEMTLFRGWFGLLQALESRLEERGEAHRNGQPIRLCAPPATPGGAVQNTLFPLHSLRVSLITALALEGQVPFPILQKLAGHSRLLMTLYYTKPGASHIRDVLTDAAKRLEENKEASIQSFLLDTDHAQLVKQAICNGVSGLATAVAPHPAARNPVGWMLMHHGLCLVGGNTSEIEGQSSVGGCYNGGALMTKGTAATPPKYGPVPGGSRNCVRCRWFVTEPHHVPALVAHFNTLAYHFDEARNACLSHEQTLQGLKKQKLEAEEAGHPFAGMQAYQQATRMWELAIKRFSDLAEDLVACWRLIERCKQALKAAPGDGRGQLVAAGTIADVHIAFEETESELLQLNGVCESVEVYPDLEPGKAVFRRSQLLDAVLYRERMPPIFMLLGEQEQLLAGNAFIRRLAEQMSPTNPALGQREVIRLMDAGVSLSQYFDIDLSLLLPHPAGGQALFAGPPPLTEAE